MELGAWRDSLSVGREIRNQQDLVNSFQPGKTWGSLPLQPSELDQHSPSLFYVFPGTGVCSSFVIQIICKTAFRKYKYKRVMKVKQNFSANQKALLYRTVLYNFTQKISHIFIR